MRVRNRRSISIRGLSYQRLRAYCAREGISMSSWIEGIIEREMERPGGEPAHHVLEPREKTEPHKRPGPKPMGRTLSGVHIL